MIRFPFGDTPSRSPICRQRTTGNENGQRRSLQLLASPYRHGHPILQLGEARRRDHFVRPAGPRSTSTRPSLVAGADAHVALVGDVVAHDEQLGDAGEAGHRGLAARPARWSSARVTMLALAKKPALSLRSGLGTSASTEIERFSALAAGLTRNRRPSNDHVGVRVDADLHRLPDGDLLGEALRHVAAQLERVVVDQIEQRRAGPHVLADRHQPLDHRAAERRAHALVAQADVAASRVAPRPPPPRSASPRTPATEMMLARSSSRPRASSARALARRASISRSCARMLMSSMSSSTASALHRVAEVGVQRGDLALDLTRERDLLVAEQGADELEQAFGRPRRSPAPR